MKTRFEFTVHGQPIPKKRPRVTRRGTFTPTETIEWERAVGWACRAVRMREQPVSMPVGIRMHFRRATQHKADLDNLIKGVLDGLNGVAWIDDSQVMTLLASVEYGSKTPGVDIEVWEL